MAEELKKELIIDASGAKKSVSDVNKELDKTEEKTESIAKTSKISWASIAGGIGLVVAVTSKLLSAFEKQDKAERQLNQAIKSTGNIAGVSAKQLKKYASEMQNLTGIGDEEIIRSQALLLTFTKISGDVFPRATETIMNMSKAMDQDLKQSTIQLGKALNDPIMGVAALRRVGVQLSAQQEQSVKDFMAVNNIAAAQNVILGELETQFGGVARATKTLSADIKNSIGDAMEVVGKEINKTLMPASGSGGGLIGAFGTFFGWMVQGLRGVGINVGIFLEYAVAMFTQAGKNIGNVAVAIFDVWNNMFEGLGKGLYDFLHGGSLSDIGKSIGEGLVKGLDEAQKSFDKLSKVSFPEFTAAVFEYEKAVEESNEAIVDSEEKKTEEVLKLNNIEHEAKRRALDNIAQIEMQHYDKMLELDIKASDTAIEIAAKEAEERTRLYWQMAETTAAIFSQLNAMEMQDIDQKYNAEKEKYNEMLENNLISKERYDTEIKKLDLKAAKEKKKALESQQKVDIAIATMNTAKAVISAFSAKDNVVTWQMWTQAALAAALGATQIATIAKQKFAKGGYVFGQGTATSDSIDAKLSNGEFVNTARTVQTFPNTIQAIDNFQKTGSMPNISNAVAMDTGRSGGGGGGTTVIQPKASATLAIKGRDLAVLVQQEINQMRREGADLEAM